MTTAKSITIPAKTLTVAISSYQHVTGDRVIVSLITGAIDASGKFTPSLMGSFDPALTQIIDGANYAALMSANPAWASAKPAGVFREDDLWHFIGT